ncbi:MAG: hypothetical protein HXY34_00460 [Candidatus Thorarchaeota archaeon]|nr:hypothetical protein [Candidatus Thorarchaeota archaeon]
MVRLALAQIEPSITDAAHTWDEIRWALRLAQLSQVDVLVLPELANSGYKFESEQELQTRSESVPEGPLCGLLAEWSRPGRLVVSGVCEADDGAYYNSAVVFASGRLQGTYRKLHLFGEERRWFREGREEPPVFEFGGHRYGVMICFDWAFPEVARILALRGAQVILHPANLVLRYCQAAMVTRSVENGIFTATANRIGQERGLRFTGGSQVTAPDGSSCAYSLTESRDLVIVGIDPTRADNKMITPHNHRILDRRPEVYGRLVESVTERL